MIRYREGKIVSTKGERFSQVTKEESEEMKKSIVNMNMNIIISNLPFGRGCGLI